MMNHESLILQVQIQIQIQIHWVFEGLTGRLETCWRQTWWAQCWLAPMDSDSLKRKRFIITVYKQLSWDCDFHNSQIVTQSLKGVVNLPRRRAEERREAGFCDEHLVQPRRNIPRCRAHWFLWQTGLNRRKMIMVALSANNAWVTFAACKMHHLEFAPSFD